MMRKKLLLTTALVALVAISDAYAKTIDKLPVNGEDGFSGVVIDEEHTGKNSAINYNADYLTDNEITIQKIYMQTLYGTSEDRKGMDVGEQVNAGSANTQKLVISDGARLDINLSLGDEADPSDAKNLFNVNGGIVEINDGEIHSEGITNISGGSITINGGELTAEDPDVAMNISGGTINIEGNSSRTSGFGVNITDSNPTEGLIETALGPVEMTGGTINVISGNAVELAVDENSTGNVITGTSLNISGGELNINEGAGVSVIKGFVDENNVATGVVNLTDEGTVNLSGTLRADVSGDGNLNINSSSAKVDGDVSGSNLTFEADHTLSQAVSGTIDNLASLNVNKGTLTYDKTDASIIIGKVEVSDGAGINLIDNGEINSQGTFTSSGNIIAGQDTAIHANGIEINNGNITLNGTDFTNDSLSESFKITDGTITMNGNQSVIGTNHGQGHEETNGKFEMTGGNIIVKGSENYIEGGDVAISGGAVNIAEKATLQTVATLAGSGILGDVATIKLTDEGTVNLSGTLCADVSGDGNLNINSSSAKVDGDVSGSNLTFEADHTLSQAITGTIGELASLNVNKGTLTYDKQIGTIGNLNVAGGLDIDTNTVNATNVDFKDNSNLSLRIASTDNYGKINADAINIGNDTTMRVTLDNGVLSSGDNETFKFLNSENIEGGFTNKIAENNRYNISWNEDGSLNISGKDTTVSDIVQDAGGSANNAATAEAWDEMSGNTGSQTAQEVASQLNDLSQNDSKSYVDALTAVAPEVAPMIQQNQVEIANQVYGAVGTRLSGGTIPTGGEGMSSGDSIYERGAMWVQTMANKAELDDASKYKGFDADTYGIAMGAEKAINDETKLGLGYAYSNSDIDGFMRSTDVDTHTAFVYGEYKPNNWYVNGIASYGWSDYSENKNVAGVGVKADYEATTLGLQTMTGYDMRLGNLGFTPEIGLRYIHISQNGYTDTAGQNVSSNDSDILTGVVGAKFSMETMLMNELKIKPEIRIAATYDMMNDDANSIVTLANGSAYQVKGESLDRFGMEFGVGVTTEVNSSVEVSLNYEGKFRQDYQDHTGLLNAKYKF